MTLKTGNAPHLRQGERSGMLSLDVLIVMIPLCIFSSFYYGLRPVLLVLTGIGTALICETVCCLMMKRRPGILDGTAAVTGGLVGLLMPPRGPLLDAGGGGRLRHPGGENALRGYRPQPV